MLSGTRVVGGGQAGEELECVLGRRTWFGGVHQDALIRIVGKVERFPGRVRSPTSGWRRACHVGGSGRRGRAQRPEVLAAGGELADEAGGPRSYGSRPASARRMATVSLDDVCPVGEDSAAGSGRRNGRVAGGPAPRAVRSTERRRAGWRPGCRGARFAGMRGSRPGRRCTRWTMGRPASGGGWRRAPGCCWLLHQVEEVGLFGLVEPQGSDHRPRARRRIHRRRCRVEAGVVLDADTRAACDLLAAQAGHSPVAAVDAEPGLLWGDPGRGAR